MKKLLYWNLFWILILTGICIFIFVLAVKNPQIFEIEGFKLLFDVSGVLLIFTIVATVVIMYKYLKKQRKE